MHGPALSGWLLMVLCSVAGGYCLLRTRSGTAGERGNARAEAVMAFGMAAMALPAAVLTPPRWAWTVYAVVFGAAALRALTGARSGGHHVHHLVGSLAMVYMAVAMAPGSAGAAHEGHTAHAAAGGVPLLTGVLLAYYALYVLRSAGGLIPVTAAPAGAPVAVGTRVAWGARPELALACRLTMGIAMFAMLLTL
ncbi:MULTISPECIES: DUF5134 domain-containing protein [Streptomyces]|uniref:DUF5134 domain-containing protein n=2 Tax=Streptomyces TaxID=1883 RepID=A0ABU2RLV2_9ACTN|nr:MULTISPECIES: DUF5134 domain-containing protein [unclassified Streptomyces]MBK3594614.1 DUF5134 domain-containing protein [Streptomyces sp. MBT51]MDT0429837.1 DUF5134 domain-containing protein [Streptomyces sp. DSM 41770]